MSSQQIKTAIKKLAEEYQIENVNTRRYLHKHPELSFQEFNTSLFVQKQLNNLGIPFKIIATTGVVGIIKGKNPESRIIALRADMDALPIQEENKVEYCSVNDGVMHACGHDVHTSVLLGAAKIINDLKEELEGTIKFIFQPGEEKNPGGASIMIKEGVLEDPKPHGILGLHVHPGLDVSKLSFRKGRVMASADEIYITIKGKGGHAAAPHLTVDTILVASQLIISLQQIISRNNNALNPSILSICSIEGGKTTNVIPSEVKLKGTFRAMDEDWRKKAHQLMHLQAQGIALATGAEIDFNIDIGYPTVDNDPNFTEQAWEIAKDYMGIQFVEETEIRMGAEDFGFYTQQIPGCFFRLGVRNEKNNITQSVHTPKFDIDENAIKYGVGTMSWLAFNLLKQ